MRISDWSSDVCSSDLNRLDPLHGAQPRLRLQRCLPGPGSHLLGCFGRASPGARPTLNPQPQLNRPRQKSNKQTDNQNPKETYMIKLTPLSALCLAGSALFSILSPAAAQSPTQTSIVVPYPAEIGRAHV